MTETPPPEFPPPTGFPPTGSPSGGSVPPPPPPSAYPPPPSAYPPPPGGAPGAPPPPPPAAYYGRTGYGYAVGGAAPVRALAGLATAVSILLGVAAAAQLLFAGALFRRASVLDGDFDLGDLTDADDAVAATVGLVLLAFLATAIVWIIWQYRHAKNAEVLGQQGGLTSGWAIGGWFIPFGNLVIPELQLVQAAKASDPEAPPGQGKAPTVLVVWWVLFVLQGVIGIASGRYGGDEPGQFTDIEDFQATDRLAGVGALVAAGAAIAGIVAVRTCTQRQRGALQTRGLTA